MELFVQGSWPQMPVLHYLLKAMQSLIELKVRLKCTQSKGTTKQTLAWRQASEESACFMLSYLCYDDKTWVWGQVGYSKNLLTMLRFHNCEDSDCACPQLSDKIPQGHKQSNGIYNFY